MRNRFRLMISIKNVNQRAKTLLKQKFGVVGMETEQKKQQKSSSKLLGLRFKLTEAKVVNIVKSLYSKFKLSLFEHFSEFLTSKKKGINQ